MNGSKKDRASLYKRIAAILFQVVCLAVRLIVFLGD